MGSVEQPQGVEQLRRRLPPRLSDSQVPTRAQMFELTQKLLRTEWVQRAQHGAAREIERS